MEAMMESPSIEIDGALEAVPADSRAVATTASAAWSLAAWPLFAGLIFLFVVDPAFLRTVASDDPLGLPLLGNTVRQVVLGSLYVLAAIVLWAHPKVIADIAARQQPMLALVGFAYLSALWSFSPGVTLTRATHFAGLLLLAWSAHCVSDPERRIVGFLRWLFAATLLASLLQVIVDPSSGISPEGAWNGIHPHKSDLGGVAVFCIAVWLPRLSRSEPLRRRLVAALVLIFATFLMVQSDSETELLGTAAIVLCWIFFRLEVPWPIKLAAAPLPILLALMWFWSFQGGTVDSWLQYLLGRDSTLTGRTPLWEAILEAVRQHPILGAGYDGFWVAGNAQAEYLIESVGWDAYHAHNGYLEVLNTIGVVGAALLAITLLQSVFWAWRYYERDHTLGLCFFLLLLWLLISNLTKSTLCQGTTHGWFLYLLSYVCVAAGARGLATNRTGV